MDMFHPDDVETSVEAEVSNNSKNTFYIKKDGKL